MTPDDLYQRIRHAQKRRQDALRRLTSRTLLGIFRVNFSKQVELQYVELGHFNSSILSKIPCAEAQEVIFPKSSSTYRHNFDSKFIVEISNVLVNTETNHIYVSGKPKNEYLLLKESSSWPTELVMVNAEKPKRQPIQKINRAALGLSTTGFYHLISDDLPDYLMNNQELPVLLYKNSSRTNRDFFASQGKLAVECDKWVFVENLTFVTKGQDVGYLHPDGAKLLKKFGRTVTDSNANVAEKIYISRSKSRRSFASENSIEEYLFKKGFKIIHAENLAFVDQITEFSKAKIVIGIHGAGLSHALWSDKCALIELMPMDRINRCFEWQTNICRGSYEIIYFDPNLAAKFTVLAQLELLSL